jgi:crossover junction endodeoxyribonuclease RusA
VIVLDVLGTPAPKGSGRAMLIGGKARHIPSGSSANQRALRAWNNAIRAAVEASSVPVTEFACSGATPLRVEILFRLERPAGHTGPRGLRPSAPLAPATKPDADKLARATLDALTGIAIHDDARIVDLIVRKRYAERGREGACIMIGRWTPALGEALTAEGDAGLPAELLPDALALHQQRKPRIA